VLLAILFWVSVVHAICVWLPRGYVEADYLGWSRLKLGVGGGIGFWKSAMASRFNGSEYPDPMLKGLIDWVLLEIELVLI
jgi:hypothetical protein